MKRRMTALLAMAIVASLLVVTAPPGLGSDRFVDVPEPVRVAV